MSEKETSSIEEIARAHNSARDERRKLEAELNGIEGEIKKAIAAGDATTLTQLGKRKRELPFLIGEAGALENSLSNKEWVARQAIPLAKIPGAEEALTEAQAALVKRKAEHVVELAALQSVIVNAQQEVSRLNNECGALGDTYGKHNVRFKEELARLNS
jgi:hypothetical protein